MGGETGQLQRLTDEQVSARLAAYNGDGSLERDVKLLRDNVADIIARRDRCPVRDGARRALRQQLQRQGRRGLDPGRRRIWPPDLCRARCSVPSYMAARTQAASRIVARMVERYADDRDKLEQLRLRLPCASSAFETDIILAQVAVLEAIDAADQRGRESERVRAPGRRPRPRQHRPVEGADRPHPLHRRIGARHARQDQRSRRRRRAVRRRDARSRADRRRPHPRHRGCPRRSRSRRRRRHPRRRPGQPGGEGQPGAVRPRRGDRIDPQPDPRHRRPDQPARAQRHHRGGTRRRCRPRLRGRRAGSEEPRLADRARHRRHHRQDHRHPAGDPPDGRSPTARSRARSRKCRPPPTASARRWSCRRRR